MNAKIALLMQIGAGQHGLVRVSDVQSVGGDRHWMQRLVTKGLFVKEGRSLWRIAAWPQNEEQRWLIACLSHGPDAMLCRSDGARLHTMPLRHPSNAVHLLCSDFGKARRHGIVTHRSRLIVPADRTEVRGIPVTSWPRTWVDLSGRGDLSDRQLLWIHDDGIRREQMTAEQVHHTASRLRSGPGRSMGRVWRLLGQRPMDHDPGASQPEGQIALWMRAAGYRKPTMNLKIRLGGILWEVDVAWVREKVGVDYQSKDIHDSPSVQEKDARKKAMFEAAGWTFLTVLPGDDEATVVERIGAHLRRGAA